MATYNEPYREFGALLSEGAGSISREVITVKSGAGVLSAGTVLGKVTTGGKYEGYDDGKSNGAETAVAVLMDNVDASSADVSAAVIVRLAEVKKDGLVWIAAVDATAKTKAYSDLAAAYVIAR
jgi:hypothetical protein